MAQMQLIDIEELQKEIKELKETLAYWTNELEFKKESDLAKIEANEAKKEFNAMWKSRSLYIEIIAVMLMELKNLPTQQHAYPIIKNFIKDDKEVNYQRIKEELKNIKGE